ncbi:hypothetical protein TCAL_00671 [Tigriopus californicus]|uniref:Ubiquitin thioesterase n=1 Tax=Tigriopus californicus TaxID=6832 RepID=A0A553PDZ9_TIGCA|nr:ubiquitin thioesterase otubain-like [Tigriopus californicus]TRY75898.1 hypothetical protein TCAL_00671 [Tigriopus californicus]|eukprot:TCALIF_00671-PA protein Name:"Similar to CG4968 Ubiquitin thioesterase otubain-like (Drosophila melanogaster)" AED:0.02 eAED:0.02 QI:0/-1/0/1/-1/1/1/0/289
MSSESPPPAASGDNQDELILAQKEAIAQDIASNASLVGNLEPVYSLEREFSHDAVFMTKIGNLKGRYAELRRTRPDGNCFFRAVAYRYFELLLHRPDEYERIKALLPRAKAQMIELGMPTFTLEDFYDNFMDHVDRVGQAHMDAQQLFETFNEPGQSDYLVVFLRLLTSMQLQRNAEFYQNFMEGDKTVAEFCATEVEPMYNESDHIHITALTEATGISLRVIYLDRGSQTEASLHDFPDQGESAATTPLVHLLYRPGHYDVIYPVKSTSESGPATSNATVTTTAELSS